MNWQSIKRSVAILLLPMMASGQQVTSPSVTLTSNSPTLQLPGSLALTTRVDPAAGSEAMPSGSVSFVSDGTSLGSAALSPIPSTESFPATVAPIQLDIFPYVGVLFPSSSVGYSGVALVDSYYDTTSATYNPEFTIYTSQGLTAPVAYQLDEATCNCPNGKDPDAAAVGDFNHDGILDMVIHGSDTSTNSSEYFVVSGKSDGTFDVKNTIASPDNSGFLPYGARMNFTADDFNGDGYADVAYETSDGIIGVSLNQGSSTPGVLKTFSKLPSPATAAAGDTFSPNMITSGHLAPSGNVDLVVAGSDISPTLDNESVAIYLGNGNGTFSSPSLVPVESLPTYSEGLSTSLAIGDLRKSGNKDLVVAYKTYNYAEERWTGDVNVLFNDGKGNFSVSSTQSPTEAPSSVAVADFNGDGYPDILVTGIYGSLFLYVNDGTGNFGTPKTLIGPGDLSSPISLVGDLNADGLPDIVELGSLADNNTAYEFLNSASSQATFVTPAKSLPAGNHTLTSAFAANANFASATSDGLAIAVTQSPTTISWSPPGPIGYGTPLGSGQLDAAGSVPGSFSYSPQAGTVLPAGQNVVTATLAPTDSFDYAPSKATQTITVTQAPTTISWPVPSPMEYGTPLGPQQLDAGGNVPGSVTYSPPAGTILPPGKSVVTATFAATDSTDYVSSTATQTITVNQPGFSSIAPAGGNLGDPATTITVNGQGLMNGAVVSYNGSPLPTTWVSLNQLTAVIPASDLLTSGTAAITVSDPKNINVTGSATFVILAAPAVASISVPSTVEADQGQPPEIALTLTSYPIPVTPVLTLNFTPDPPNTATDPTMGFTNGSTTLQLPTIPANSSAPIDPIPFSVGSTAGAITLTVQFTTNENGTPITIPSNLQPTTITVPASPPSITSVTLNRGTSQLTVLIQGISSTREMTEANFHFTPSPGNTLETTDFTIQLASPFSSFYQSAAAATDNAGTGYLYTQPFTLNKNSNTVGSVTVTLVNSQGQSQPITAQ